MSRLNTHSFVSLNILGFQMRKMMSILTFCEAPLRTIYWAFGNKIQRASYILDQDAGQDLLKTSLTQPAPQGGTLLLSFEGMT